MNPYTRRFVGFLCLSMFLALAVGPYSGERLEERTMEAVFLSAVGLTESTTKPACLQRAIEIDIEKIEKFPDIKKAVIQLQGKNLEKNQVHLYSEDLRAFMAYFNNQEENHLCFRYNGRIYKLVWTIISKFGWLYLIGLERMPADIPVLSKSRLEAFPALKAYIQALDHAAAEARKIHQDMKTGADESDVPKQPDLISPGFSSNDMEQALEQAKKRYEKINRNTQNRLKGIESQKWLSLYEEKRRDMGPAEWTVLIKAVGNASGRVRFTCGGYLIMGRSEAITESILIDLLWFKPFRYIFAGVLLLLGVFGMRSVYGRRPGIRLNPIGAIVVGDGIIILFLGFGAFCLIDHGLVRFLQMTSILDEPVIRVMCAIAYLPVTLFFAIFSANLGSQSIVINNAGIRIHYPGRVHFFPWNAVSGFSLRPTYVLVGRIGILMPRKLQTKLVIESGESKSSIVEPGHMETKNRLLYELKEAAPERLHADLNRLREAW